MPSNTSYAQLYLYNNTTDKETLFSEFRERLAGTADTSNMQKIDKLLSQDNDRITNLEKSPSILTAKATTSDSGNNFVVTIEGFTEYKQDMIMAIYLSQNNIGLTTININNIGIKSLMKIGDDGTPTNLEANDLKKNVGYLFQYDGTQFVLLQEKTFESLNKDYLKFKEIEEQPSVLNFIEAQAYIDGTPASISTFTKSIYSLTSENEVGERLDNILDNIQSDLNTHKSDTNNPHNVTAAQVGLGNVNNTADSEKSVASAGKLTNARTIAISGGATGTATSFDGTKNITIPVTAVNPAKISSGTLVAGVKATNSTDYTTSRLRNIRASTTDLTAGTSALSNGEIYLVYE